MDFLAIGCEEIVANTITKKKVKRSNQKKRKSNSKILKHLLYCLSENKHAHMLEPSRKKEFKVKYTNKKSRKWEKRDISLFKEMDDIFPKLRKKASYDEDCKVRFKANMQKLCSSGFLKLESCKKESASVTIVTFKILRYTDGDRPVKAKSERKMMNDVKMDRAVVNRESQFTASTETSVENGPNMVSLALVPGDNQIEANGNSGLPFNSTYYFKPMQEENEVPTKYNNDIEANENPGIFFNIAEYLQREDVVDNTYDNWNNRIGGELIGEESGGYEEIMIGKDPVLSSTWKKDDIMDDSNFMHSEGDNWMAEFSTSLFE